MGSKVTIEKIKVFDRYKGDPDMAGRSPYDKGLKLFEGDEWMVIDRFYAHVPMINNNLADRAYITRVIKELQGQCDPEACMLLTSKLTIYKHFQGVINILQQIKSYTPDNADTVWAGYDNAAAFLTVLEQDITSLEYCDFRILEEIKIKFLPTAAYQELAVSNGWGDAYLKLSEEFDQLYDRITKKQPEYVDPLPAPKPVWWKRLFGFK